MKLQGKMLDIGIFIFLLVVTSFTSKSNANAANGITEMQSPYPPPGTPHSPAGSLKNYLPLIFESREHSYAQAFKNGVFYGVWATISTADPAIREPVFSYASINIQTSDGKWVETGWAKELNTGCVPKFIWAIQPGVGHIIPSPVPVIGVSYQYQVYKLSDGNWRLRIMQTNGVVIVQIDISNPGMNSGTQIQATGEVYSPRQLNDMGVSSMKSLKWKGPSSWSNWNGWLPGIIDNPPYHVVGVQPDLNNNVQVFGNNGNPIPPNAPCP